MRRSQRWKSLDDHYRYLLISVICKNDDARESGAGWRLYLLLRKHIPRRFVLILACRSISNIDFYSKLSIFIFVYIYIFLFIYPIQQVEQKLIDN